jgi:hypothetical protein
VGNYVRGTYLYGFVGGPLFLTEVFIKPLHFKVATFFIEGLFYHLFFSSKVFLTMPLHFRIASFFIRGLFNRAPCILGLPLFSSEVVLTSPLRFWVPLFSSEDFLTESLAF